MRAPAARGSLREAAMEATRARILDVAADAFRDDWYDAVTLRDIAAAAGVALQTVLNHFDSKESLFAAAQDRIRDGIEATRFSVQPGDVSGGIDALVDDYERSGDATVRNLAMEDRIPALVPMLTTGRAGHEAWVEHVFAPALEGLRGAERRRRVAQLVVVTDVYSWKLFRRDKGLSVQATKTAMRELVLALHPGGGPR